MRISRTQMFMGVARIVAQRSTCMRLNVGAVIVVRDRIVSIGYNGSPPGAPHCAGNNCPGRDQCTLTTHAEANAFRYVPESAWGAEMDLYVTHSPCAHCVKLILSHEVNRVFFETPFRDTSPLDLMRDIPVYQALPAGYVMEWATKRIVEMP